VTRKAATAAPALAISLGGAPNRRFFKDSAPHLRRLLEHSGTRLILRADAMPAQYLKPFERLLAPLASHGDRIFLVLSESLRERVTIDLSVFNLVMGSTDPRFHQP
jgi:hypothetical protein